MCVYGARGTTFRRELSGGTDVCHQPRLIIGKYTPQLEDTWGTESCSEPVTFRLRIQSLVDRRILDRTWGLKLGTAHAQCTENYFDKKYENVFV